MFDSIVLRNSEDEGPITLGAIAEALLYYQNTRIIISPGTLDSLARTNSLEAVVKLVKEKRMQAVHCEEILCTSTQRYGATTAHDFAAFKTIGNKDERGRNRAERIEISLRTLGLSHRQAKFQARDFVDSIPKKDLSTDDYVNGGMPEAVRLDMQNPVMLKGLLKTALAAIPGGYEIGDDLQVDCVRSDLGYFVFTNIDFAYINKRRANMAPALGPITIANLLNLIQDSRADMHLAAFYGGDFSTTGANSALVRWRQAHLFERSERNREAREQFSELVLPDSPSIRDVIDSGERSFKEFLSLLDKAQKFKTWLAKANPDQKLGSQYIEALKSDTWADKAPVKMLRYVFFFGAGLVDPTKGIVSGVFDSFLLDRFMRGWRPNHFVDERLKPFLASMS